MSEEDQQLEAQGYSPDDFTDLEGPEEGEVRNLDMVLDIPVTVSVEIGQAASIRSLLQLTQGSVVELDHLAVNPWMFWLTER